MKVVFWQFAGPRRPLHNGTRVPSLIVAAFLAAICCRMGLPADAPRVQLIRTPVCIGTTFIGTLTQIEFLAEIRTKFDFAFVLALFPLALAPSLVLKVVLDDVTNIFTGDVL